MSYIEELENRIEQLEADIPHHFADCIHRIQDRLEWLRIILENEYPDSKLEIGAGWTRDIHGVQVKHMIGDVESSSFIIPWEALGDSEYVLVELQRYYVQEVAPTRRPADIDKILEEMGMK